jgi:hypothetical protein
LKFIEDILPEMKIYDSIVNHDEKKPHVYDNNKYNDFCDKNEKNLINCFLKQLYP